MKFLKLLLIPLMILGVSACSSNNKDNEITTSEVQSSWTYQEEAMMKNVLNGNVVPYFSKPNGGKWVGVELSSQNEYKKRYGIAYEIEKNDPKLITMMRDSCLEMGFSDKTNVDKDKNPILELKLPKYDINHEVLICEPQLLRGLDKFGALFYYSADTIKWNQQDVDSAILHTLDERVSLPEPEFSYTKVEVFEFTDTNPKTVGIGLYTNDKGSVSSYYQTLTKANYESFEIEAKPGSFAFIDPENKITVTVTYNETEKVCVIGVINA